MKPSRKCASFIFESFKNELDPNGINWKGVSNDIRDGYFGEFKKYFYWDSSINEGVVRTQWEVKAATRYIDFISKKKKRATLSHPLYLKMCGNIGHNFGEMLRMLRGQK